MMEWDEESKEVSKVAKDEEKAKSLMSMATIREEALKNINTEQFTSIVVEGHYEIVKELITALTALAGYKIVRSHKMLIAYLKHHYTEFEEYEIIILDELRKIRNKINYNGFNVKKQYWERNKYEIRNIIKKLKSIIRKKPD